MINKKTFFVLVLLVLVFVAGIVAVENWGKSANSTSISSSSSSETSILTPTSAPVIPADKIEVVHFHGTQQCWSCINVGKYALKTIKEKFPEEYASGKIVFQDINGELKENQEIVLKYQARGSSLFINAIRGETDDIAEDVTVWRLVNNEAQFINYFENVLKNLLGK